MCHNQRMFCETDPCSNLRTGRSRVVNGTMLLPRMVPVSSTRPPAFGEVDHRVAVDNGIICSNEMPPRPIDDAGQFTKEDPCFAGQHAKIAAKDGQKVLKVNCRLIVQSY